MQAVPRALALALLFSACSSPGEPASTPSPNPNPRILLFTRTKGFVHRSIAAATGALQASLTNAGATVEATDDAARFTDAALAGYDAVVFLLTTGDVLSEAQQSSFEGFIRKGRGFAGIHSASDTEYDWSWYQELVGATFKRHPKPQRATLRIADSTHLSTRNLPSPWVRTEEWYDFRAPLPAAVRPLITIDESTYSGGTMGSNHPIAWCRQWDGGRSWYTAMGHADESWREPDFIAHVTGGVLSVSREGSCEPA